MRLPPRLSVAALSLLLVSLPAAPARAVATASLPPDLQQLLTAAKALSPRQIAVHVRVTNAAKPSHDLTVTLAASDAPRGGELELSAGGHRIVSRFLGGREYDAIPGTSRLTDHRIWVYQPDPGLAKDANPAGEFEREVQTGFATMLKQASSVTEDGPTVVAGRAATAFSLVTPTSEEPLVVDIAASGQILLLSIVAPMASVTTSISTDVPVTVTRPPAKASIALKRLSKKQRSAFTHASQAYRFTEGLLLSVTLGLA